MFAVLYDKDILIVRITMCGNILADYVIDKMVRNPRTGQHFTFETAMAATKCQERRMALVSSM